MDIESAEDEPEIAKVRDFFVTVTGGLEDVALREIKSTLKGVSNLQVHRRQRVGRIHFRYDRSPRKLLDLTCVEGVFANLAEFGGVTVGRPGLIRVAEQITSVDLAPGVVLYNILNGMPDTSGVAVNCTVGRGHRFSASELNQILRVVLAETYELDESEQQGPYYLQVRIEGRRALVGFRLTERSLPNVRGDLTYSTAAGIGALIAPERGTTWVDVACRGGVLMWVLAEAYGIRPRLLETNRDWAGLLPGSVALWDGDALPIADGCANGVLINARRRREIRFDVGLQEECRRILAPYGRVVLLSERDRDLEADSESSRGLFRFSDRYPLHVGGDSVSLYSLRVRQP